MNWIASRISNNKDKILEESERALQETGEPGLAVDEVIGHFRTTIDLLVTALNMKDPGPLLSYWRGVGEAWAARDISLSDLPSTINMLGDGIRKAMEIEASEKENGFTPGDLTDAVLVVGSVLDNCWLSMMHSYLDARDVRIFPDSRRMEPLYAFTESLVCEEDDGCLFRAIVDGVSLVTGIDRCTLLLLDEKGRLLPVAANNASGNHNVKGVGRRELEALHAITSLRGPVVLSRGNSPVEIESIFDVFDAKSLLLVPLCSLEQDLGAIVLDDPSGGGFKSEQVSLAVAAGNQATLAIERSRTVSGLENKLKQMSALGLVARSVSSSIDQDEQMEGLLGMGCAMLNADSGAVLLYEEMFGKLEEQAVTGAASWVKTGLFEEMSRRASEAGEPVTWTRGAPGLRGPDGEHTVQSAIVAPIMVREKAIGMLAVGSSRAEDSYGIDELDIYRNFAAQAAVTIENSQLYQRIQDTYIGAIGSLAAAIEARDPYTVGHSARVTQYAVVIAQSMGLSAEQVEEVRLAALLHDVGKIGIPDRILNKNGHLSDEEYAAIKMHPALSMRIVEPLPQLANIIPLIYHHHERYDGKGYLEGKGGKDIPLGARILTVADSYEAMTSDRPYRIALSRNEAIAELERHSSTQFDPEVVDHFLRLLESN